MKGDSIYAGFWRRIAAFVIDSIIIGIAMLLLSFLLKDIFLNLGENLWYIGFIAIGIYFVIFNSSLGKGQTIGKKLLKIRVVHEKGKFLTLFQSFFRYTIIGLVIFSSGIGQSVYSLAREYNFITTIFTMLAIFLFLGIFGLIIFTKDKRGLHDYLTKTVVIKNNNVKEIRVPKLDSFTEAFKNHKLAFIIILILFLIISLLIIIVPKLLMSSTLISGVDFNAMTELKGDLEKNFDISNVGIQTQWNTYLSNGQTETTKNLIISGYLKYSTYNDKNIKEEKYNLINAKVLSSYPDIERFDNLVVVFRTGYNLGIANFDMNENKVFLIKNSSITN